MIDEWTKDMDIITHARRQRRPKTRRKAGPTKKRNTSNLKSIDAISDIQVWCGVGKVLPYYDDAAAAAADGQPTKSSVRDLLLIPTTHHHATVSASVVSTSVVATGEDKERERER